MCLQNFLSTWKLKQWALGVWDSQLDACFATSLAVQDGSVILKSADSTLRRASQVAGWWEGRNVAVPNMENFSNEVGSNVCT